MKIRKKQPVTLLEILVVIFLIGLIISILAFNYQGTLEKGKLFKTKVGKEKLETVLNLHLAEYPERAQDIEQTWKSIVERAPEVKDPKDLIKDGWGYEYKVRIDPETGAVRVTSEMYEKVQKSR